MESAANAEKLAIVPPLIGALRERALLEWIQIKYLSLNKSLTPPSGVWIRRYPPVPLDADSVNDGAMFPHAVWFLDENGLRRENIWKWRRFVTVHWQQPWCKRISGEPSTVMGRPYLIGLAAFAPYEVGNDFYVETQWAGLFGHGWRTSVSDTGAVGGSEIWIS